MPEASQLKKAVLKPIVRRKDAVPLDTRKTQPKEPKSKNDGRLAINLMLMDQIKKAHQNKKNA